MRAFSPVTMRHLAMKCSPQLTSTRGSMLRSLSTQAVSSVDTLRPGQVIKELECLELAFGGDGLCKLSGGLVVFVPRALPGEIFSAKIASVSRGFARAEKLVTLRPHSDPAEPQCPHYGPCGGCSLQNLRYAAQLAAKEQQIADLLQRVARVENPLQYMRPIIPCDKRYEYRNKMEFSVGGRGEKWTLGLHRPGSQHDVMQVSTCSLQTATANEILTEAEALCRDHGVQGGRTQLSSSSSSSSSGGRGDRRSRGGGGKLSSSRESGGARLQHLVIRHSVSRDRYLINFVTAGDGRKALAPVAAALQERFGESLAGVVNSVVDRQGPRRGVFGEFTLCGSSKLVEVLHGVEYEVSANSFFQVNTAAAEKLFAAVIEAAELKSSDTVLDLYCGAGAITLLLARLCQRAYGVEIAAAAVEDAIANAKRNGIANAEFFCDDAGMEELPAALSAADVVVVDPARAGLTLQVVRSIRSTAARKLVYVSCNPATQARDLAALCGEGDEGGSGPPFRLISVQPVDLYPHTPHVEVVAVLER